MLISNLPDVFNLNYTLKHVRVGSKAIGRSILIQCLYLNWYLVCLRGKNFSFFFILLSSGFYYFVIIHSLELRYNLKALEYVLTSLYGAFESILDFSRYAF